jgi:hypothetical protein
MPGEGRRGNRALLQQEARDATPAEVGVDALDDEGREMLQFQRESRLDAHNERRRNWVVFPRVAMLPHRPLHLDRPRHRGEPLADNIVPKQNETGMAKTLPRQNRVDRGLNEVRERPGARDVTRAAFPHTPFYLALAGAPREKFVDPKCFPGRSPQGASGASSGYVAAKQSGRAILKFLERNILLMSRDPPAMAGRVLEFAAALAVELIRDRPKNLYASANGTGRERIDILNVEVDHDRGSSDRLRTQGIVVGKFVAKHDLRLADFEFRMSDLAPMLDA